jgi:glutaredoxin
VSAQRLTLYSRRDCHLCDQAYALIERLRAEPGARFELEVLDVDQDPEARRRYGDEVPVLLVDGKKFAKVRFDESRLRRKLSL